MTGTCLVLGAGGRVGRLLRGVWKDSNGAAPVLYQSRSHSAGIDIVAPLDARLSNRIVGPVSSILVLSGVTRGTSAELAKNTDCALAGLELARQVGARRVFICSSAAVYGAEQGHPAFTETYLPRPGGPYGLAKWDMEQAVERWCKQTRADIQVICLRMANMIGADQLAQSVRQASADAPLMLDQFSDGRSPRRSFLSPGTFAAVIHGFSQHSVEPGFQVFNLADGGPAVPMSEILMALAACGHEIPWAWKPAPDNAIPEVALDTSSLQARLPDCVRLSLLTNGATQVSAWLSATGDFL